MWVFRRNEKRLIHELRKNGSGYELVIGYHDGWVDIEHFPDAVKAEHYALDLRRALKEAGWQPSFFVDGQAAPPLSMVKLLPCEGAPSGQHLVKHDPEGPHVGALYRPALP